MLEIQLVNLFVNPSTFLHLSQVFFFLNDMDPNVRRLLWGDYNTNGGQTIIRIMYIFRSLSLVQTISPVRACTSEYTCLFKSNALFKCQLNKSWQFHVRINLISTGTEKCTSHITSQDQAGGRCLSSRNYKGFADGYEFTISLNVATS